MWLLVLNCYMGGVDSFTDFQSPIKVTKMIKHGIMEPSKRCEYIFKWKKSTEAYTHKNFMDPINLHYRNATKKERKKEENSL